MERSEGGRSGRREGGIKREQREGERKGKEEKRRGRKGREKEKRGRGGRMGETKKRKREEWEKKKTGESKGTDIRGRVKQWSKLQIQNLCDGEERIVTGQVTDSHLILKP